MKVKAYKEPNHGFYTILCAEKDFMEGSVLWHSRYFNILDPSFGVLTKRSLGKPSTWFKPTKYPCIEGELTFAKSLSGYVAYDKNIHISYIDNCSARLVINTGERFEFVGSNNPITTEDGKLLMVRNGCDIFYYDLMGLYK